MTRYQRICEWCGYAFFSDSPDARFCDDRCRRAALQIPKHPRKVAVFRSQSR